MVSVAARKQSREGWGVCGGSAAAGVCVQAARPALDVCNTASVTGRTHVADVSADMPARTAPHLRSGVPGAQRPSSSRDAPAQVFQGATVGVVFSRGRVRERTKFRKPPRGGCTLLARARAGGGDGRVNKCGRRKSDRNMGAGPPCRRRLAVACARGGEPDTWRGDGEATLLVD